MALSHSRRSTLDPCEILNLGYKKKTRDFLKRNCNRIPNILLYLEDEEADFIINKHLS